jgi:hypothetical protein
MIFLPWGKKNLCNFSKMYRHINISYYLERDVNELEGLTNFTIRYNLK